MKNIMKTRKKVLAIAVSALTLAGVGGVAPVAFADNVNTGFHLFPATKGQPETGNIDTSKDGHSQIVVHKMRNKNESSAKGDISNGTLQGGVGIKDVHFKYAPVMKNEQAVDLKTTDGWKYAKELEKVSPKELEKGTEVAGFKIGKLKDAGATSEEGVLTIDNLDLGVYLVVEGDKPKNITASADPFIVTVPYPKEDGNWEYSVNVFPKNTVIDNDERPVKTLNNKDAVHFAGDTASWKIVQKVPEKAATDKITTFKIVDNIREMMNPIASEDKVTVAVTDAQGSPVNFTGNIVKQLSDGDRMVTIDFKNVLNELKPGYVITVTIETTVSDKIGTENNESLLNQSDTIFAINDGEEVKFPSVPTTPTEDEPQDPTEGKDTGLDFGTLKIDKINKGQQPLNDAVFSVVAVASEQEVGAECAATGSPGTKALTTGTTGNAGNGKAEMKLAIGKYCLQETVAPQGYLNEGYWSKGHVIEILKDNISFKTDEAGASPSTHPEIQVTNVRPIDSEDGIVLPSLPLTGAAGFILLTFAGVAIVATAVGTGFIAVGRKKREQDA